MRRLVVLGTAFALVTTFASACASFSSEDTPATVDDGGPSADGASVGVTGDDGGEGGSDAGASCSGGCPANAVCEEGACVLTGCQGDGGVVLLHPKTLLDSKGSWTTFPAGTAILDAIREHGDGDGDKTYVDGVGAGPLTLRVGTELFTLPAGRAVQSVILRARARRESTDGGAGSADLTFGYHFRSFDGVFSQLPVSVGAGYGVAQFQLANHPFPTYAPPHDASANQWDEGRVNDIDLDIGVALNPTTVAFRLTQLWIEVCLTAK